MVTIVLQKSKDGVSADAIRTAAYKLWCNVVSVLCLNAFAAVFNLYCSPRRGHRKRSDMRSRNVCHPGHLQSKKFCCSCFVSTLLVSFCLQICGANFYAPAGSTCSGLGGCPDDPQFPDNCCPGVCPANSRSAPGSASIADCLCLAGAKPSFCLRFHCCW